MEGTGPHLIVSNLLAISMSLSFEIISQTLPAVHRPVNFLLRKEWSRKPFSSVMNSAATDT